MLPFYAGQPRPCDASLRASQITPRKEVFAMLISFAMIVVAAFALRRIGSAVWLGWVISASLLGVVVLTITHIGMTLITGEGVNGAVFYHMKTGLKGGDATQYALPAAGAFFVLAVVAACLWRWRHLLLPGAVRRRSGLDAVIAVFAATALIVHPVSLASAQYALRFALVPQHAAGFVAVNADTAGPEIPRNLVVLYLESLERTYMDPALFPGLTPNLADLEARAISFTDMGQTTGAGFTIGGMVATQCGFPLILSGGANSMRVSSFLNGATCLGDILKNTGYRLSYLGGASTEFAGKGAFYRSHGYDEVTGLDELLPRLPDPNYRAEWGIQDDTLFELARKRFDVLASEDTPFALTILTLDTHHPNGHAETNRACENLTYGDGSNPMLNSVHCADHMAGEFVREILAGPHGENTVVVVMSDHLAMVNAATDLLEKAPRRNLMMLLDKATASAPKSIDRPSTTLDAAPTMLGHLGFDVPSMGLGVNLLGQEETLSEKLDASVDEKRVLDAHVMGYESVYTRLWAFPDISNGLYVNAERGEVNFGYSAFRTPVLLSFDDDDRVTGATLGDVRADETLSEAALNLPEGTRYVWIDRCLALGPENQYAHKRDQLCALAGRRGNSVRLQPFLGSGFHSEAAVADLLSGLTDETEASGDDAVLERIGQALGDLPRYVPISGLATGDRGVLVQSSAFGAGASFVRRQTTETLTAGEDWILGRGVNLVGITADGRAELIDRLDQCDPKFDASKHVPWGKRIREGSAAFVAHIVTVHDTAFCGSSSRDLEGPLAGLDMPKLRSAGMREAYVAVFDEFGTLREFPNPVFDRVRIFLEPGNTPGTNDALPPRLGAAARTGQQTASKNNVVAAATGSITKPAVVGAVETTVCVAPASVAELFPEGSLNVGTRISGMGLSSVVGYSEGWWGEEPAGRWSGKSRTKIAVILPNMKKELQLTLGLAAPKGQVRDLEIAHEARVLAKTRLRGNYDVSIDVGDLPRGRPVYLTIAVGGSELDCPAQRSGAADPRTMGVMLKSISLEASTSKNANLSTAADAAMNPLCALAGAEREPLRVTSSIPSNMTISASEGLNARAISFGQGWWQPEKSGVWMGNRSAHFSLMLPENIKTLGVEFQVTAFGTDDVELALWHEGQLIGRQRSGEDAPFRADVSDLPRGKPLSLILTLPNTVTLSCPASINTGPDGRALGIMLKALRLKERTAAPFTSAIAHGGGRLGGAAITNSFEAIGENLARFDVFEIDFSWTADNKLVCLHDWDQSFNSRFGVAIEQPLEHERFNRLLAASSERPRNCDLDGLAGWMRANPSIRIITDVKDRPQLAHKLIAERHPDLLAQFVPQAFEPAEIDSYRSLGYREVIWTLYRFGSDSDRIIREARERRPSAITMPVSLADAGLLPALREVTVAPVYVHTVNDPSTAACLLRAGAAGIYSDDLGKDEVAALRYAPDRCLEKT